MTTISRKSANSYFLAPGVTVGRYKALVKSAPPDRKALAEMVRRRFAARYIDPITDEGRPRGGFAAIALCCLAIQALHCFRNRRHSSNFRAAMETFVKENQEFASLRGCEGDFCKNVRDALHHQGQTDGGWRINLAGPVYSRLTLSVGAQNFLKGFNAALDRYCVELEASSDTSSVWKNFVEKMEMVIGACDFESGTRR